jgi:hypothetical protein
MCISWRIICIIRRHDYLSDKISVIRLNVEWRGDVNTSSGGNFPIQQMQTIRFRPNNHQIVTITVTPLDDDQLNTQLSFGQIGRGIAAAGAGVAALGVAAYGLYQAFQPNQEQLTPEQQQLLLREQQQNILAAQQRVIEQRAAQAARMAELQRQRAALQQGVYITQRG